MSFLNVSSVIALWLCLSTGAFFLLAATPPTSPLALSLLVFNNLNIFIAMCEICLGFNIAYIQRDYQKLRAKHKGREGAACLAFLTMPLTPRLAFDPRVWSKMWSTYALYDPSYQSHDSFGFFIDFGNGLSTIPPSVLVNLAIVCPQKVSPLWVGCIGLAMYWQVMYGTIIYVLSFVFNKRYEGHPPLVVGCFVGVSNSLWFFFPMLGIYACVCMLRDGNIEVFQRS